MTNDTRALTVQQSQQLASLSDYSPAELDLIKQTIAKDCSDVELALFVTTARSRGLNPFARQLYAIKYKGKMAMVTGIDGYRAIAERSGRYAGSDEPQYGPMVRSDGVDHPEYVVVTVYKVVAGLRVPFVGKAYWDEFARKFNGQLGDMWESMPRNQLSKCAEAQALRKGFAEQLEGIEYSDDPSIPIMELAPSIGASPATTVAPSAPAQVAPYDATKFAPIWCAVHEREWKENKYGYSHPTEETRVDPKDGKEKTVFCNRKNVIAEEMVRASNDLGYDREALQNWCRAQWDNPPSKLNDDEVWQSIGLLRAEYERQRAATEQTAGEETDDGKQKELPL